MGLTPDVAPEPHAELPNETLTPGLAQAMERFGFQTQQPVSSLAQFEPRKQPPPSELALGECL